MLDTKLTFCSTEDFMCLNECCKTSQYNTAGLYLVCYSYGEHVEDLLFRRNIIEIVKLQFCLLVFFL